jgi:tRNA pseudouridine55 synthase
MLKITVEEIVEGKVFLLDKPVTWTSFDLVKKVKNVLRRTYGLKKLKVGHAGTLDPLASGLLIVCTGRATKKINEWQELDKTYVAELELGKTTPSYDLETEIDGTYPTSHITRELFEQTMAGFVGQKKQVPPLFSAKWVDGTRAYRHARSGKKIELEPRTVFIIKLECIEFSPPKAVIYIQCSKGTYIRSLARDIGTSLDSGAYLSALRREKIGEFSVNDAYSIEDFENMFYSM